MSQTHHHLERATRWHQRPLGAIAAFFIGPLAFFALSLVPQLHGERASLGPVSYCDPTVYADGTPAPCLSEP